MPSAWSSPKAKVSSWSRDSVGCVVAMGPPFSAQFERERLEAAKRDVRLPADRGFRRKPEPRKAPQQAGKGDLRLEARQGGADAEVHPVSEGEVAGVAPGK